MDMDQSPTHINRYKHNTSNNKFTTEKKNETFNIILTKKINKLLEKIFLKNNSRNLHF